MAGDTSLGPFEPSDSFLRRVAKKKAIQGGIVSWEAFNTNDERLSFTFMSEGLATLEGVNRYRVINTLPSKDLPGVCRLTLSDLVEVEPPLPPKHALDEHDSAYGHLHCETDKPTEKQCKQMAHLATKHTDCLFEFVRAMHRTDL